MFNYFRDQTQVDKVKKYFMNNSDSDEIRGKYSQNLLKYSEEYFFSWLVPNSSN